MKKWLKLSSAKIPANVKFEWHETCSADNIKWQTQYFILYFILYNQRYCSFIKKRDKHPVQWLIASSVVFIVLLKMVWYSNDGLKTWLKKAFYGPKCPVFVWSCDFTIWIPDTHSVSYSSVRYSDGYCSYLAEWTEFSFSESVLKSSPLIRSAPKFWHSFGFWKVKSTRLINLGSCWPTQWGSIQLEKPFKIWIF